MGIFALLPGLEQGNLLHRNWIAQRTVKRYNEKNCKQVSEVRICHGITENFSVCGSFGNVAGLLTGCGGAQGASDALNTEELLTASNEDILAEAERRKDTFYSRITDIQSAGTVYYISHSGDNNNDGLSPETAWATLGRAFETYWPLIRDLLKPGDTVLLERGGTWYVSPDE